MAVIANLDIILGARTEKAEKSLRNASTITDKLTKSVLGLAAAYLSFRSVTSVVGSVVDSVGTAFEEIDKIGKAAQRLDIPVADMQAFSHAAELAGSDFETVVKAVSIMQRRLSEATLTKPLLTSLRPFQQLGIDLEQFGALNATAQFSELADRLSQVSNAADRARIASELFGRSGGELLPMLLETGAAIEDVVRFLKEYGIELNDIDVAKIMEANDAWTDTLAVLKGVRNELAVVAAPGVQFLAEELTRNIRYAKAREVSLISFLTLGVPGFLDRMAKFKPPGEVLGPPIPPGFYDARDELEAIDDTAAKVLEDMEKRAERFGVALRTPLEEFRAQLEELQELSPHLSMENVRRGSTAAIERFRKSLESNEPIAIQANISAAERGSQEAATRLLRQTFENDKDIQQDMLSAEQEAARVLNDILFETRKRVIALIPAGF